MSISLRLSETEATLIKNYAAMKRMSVSELLRQTVLERIEDEIDLKAYEKAMEEHQRQNNIIHPKLCFTLVKKNFPNLIEATFWTICVIGALPNAQLTKKCSY